MTAASYSRRILFSVLCAAVLIAVTVALGPLQASPAPPSPAGAALPGVQALNANQWYPLQFGVNGSVEALAVDGTTLYVGGSFTEICGNLTCDQQNTRANRIARWDGSHWSTVGNGMDGTVLALAAHGGEVYAGGSFLHTCADPQCAGTDQTVNHVAYWNGSAWSALDHGVDDRVFALALRAPSSSVGTEVFAGGAFTRRCANSSCSIVGTVLNRIGRWSSITDGWTALGNGVNNTVSALAVKNPFGIAPGNLYAGGNMTKACGNSDCSTGLVTVNHIAKWDNTAWTALAHGFDFNVLAIAFDGTDVYAGGSLRNSCGNGACDKNNQPVNFLAQFDGAAWSPLDEGLNGVVSALVVKGGVLYAAGGFSETCGNDPCNSGGSTLRRVGKWNGSAWSQLDNGLATTIGSSVYALASSGNDLVAGGSFSVVCASSACSGTNTRVNSIARFGPPPPTATPTATATPTITHTPTRTNTPTVTPTNNCLAVPSKPVLTKPANHASLATTRPTLEWTVATCADTYTVIVKNTVTGKAADKQAGLVVLKYKTDPLAHGGSFKWFVKACNSAGCTRSVKRFFSVQ